MTGVFFDNIDLSYFTTNYAVGSSGDDPGTPVFSFNTDVAKFDGTNWIRSLTFWYDNCISCCEVQLNGATESATFGRRDGNKSDTFVFGNGEKLTSLKIWYIGYNNGRLGGVQWTTSENRSFAFGYQNGAPTYSPNVGSGILIGLFGNYGSDIDCLGFAIFRTIKTARLIDLDYPNLDTAQVQSAPMSIKTIRYDNSNGSIQQQFTFSGEMEVTNTSTWSLTTSVTLGLSYEVSAGIPLFVSKTKSVSLEMSVSGTYESSTTTRTTESFSFPLNVLAGRIIRATATLYEANISTEYTATMAFTLDTGKEIKFVVEGMYSGIDSDRVEVIVEEEEK